MQITKHEQQQPLFFWPDRWNLYSQSDPSVTFCPGTSVLFDLMRKTLQQLMECDYRSCGHSLQSHTGCLVSGVWGVHKMLQQIWNLSSCAVTFPFSWVSAGGMDGDQSHLCTNIITVWEASFRQNWSTVTDGAGFSLPDLLLPSLLLKQILVATRKIRRKTIDLEDMLANKFKKRPESNSPKRDETKIIIIPLKLNKNFEWSHCWLKKV